MEYEITGGAFPVLICHLKNGEQMVTQKGGMAWMSPNLEMETIGGSVGKAFSRAFAGEAMFRNIYTAKGAGTITFASSYPGRILALEVTPQRGYILQKSAFLASEMGVEMELEVNKKRGSGFFGGEGWFMQQLSGQGMAFVEVNGELVEKHLEAGEKILVSTGRVLGYESGMEIAVEKVKGTKNKLLGGQGFYHTTLEGPGTVWLQTLTLSNLAEALAPFLPSKG